jgi:spermidine/putrescine-binding protein
VRLARRTSVALLASVVAAAVTGAPVTAQQQQRPNIVIIWGDDVGQSNVSAYSRGVWATPRPTSTALRVKA